MHQNTFLVQEAMSCPPPPRLRGAMRQYLQRHLQIVSTVVKDNTFSYHKSILAETRGTQLDYKPCLSLEQGHPVPDLGQRGAAPNAFVTKQTTQRVQAEQHCRRVPDLWSENRLVLMNIKMRIIFRLLLYLPGDTPAPGYLHKAQLAEDWEEKCGLILDVSINIVQITDYHLF